MKLATSRLNGIDGIAIVHDRNQRLFDLAKAAEVERLLAKDPRHIGKLFCFQTFQFVLIAIETCLEPQMTSWRLDDMCWK